MPSRNPPIPSSFRPSSSSSSAKPHQSQQYSSSLQRSASRSSRVEADLSSHGQSYSRSSSASGSANVGSTGGSMVRPLSLSELADRANTVSDTLLFSSTVPLRRYLNGVEALRRQAGVYRREGDREMEFICLVKCARLLIDILPTQHPSYRDLAADTKRKLKADSQNLLDQIQDVKTYLLDRYEGWNRLSPTEKAKYKEPDARLLGTGARRQLDLETTSSNSSSGGGGGGGKSPVNSLSGSGRDAEAGAGAQQQHHQDPFGLSSSSSTASDSSAKGKTPSIQFIKPDRSNDGFDLRKLAGFGVKQRRESPKEVQFQQTASPSSSVTAFSSNPLKPFSHAHTKSKSAALNSPNSTYKSSAQPSSSSVTVLRPSLSHRMSVHQKQQGFAPSNQATARYYQTLRKSSDPPRATDEHGGGSSSSPSKSLSVPLPPLPDGSGRRSRGPLPPLPRSSQPHPSHQQQQPPAHSQVSTTSTASAAHSHSRTTLEEAMAQMSVGYGNSQAIENDTASIRHFPTPFLLTPSASTSSLHSSSSYSILSTALSASQETRPPSTGKPSFDYPRSFYTEGGDPLRPMEVPSSLISAFLANAKPNTDRNLETCALLQGMLHQGTFIVSHLVFPQQTATSDSCTTQDEEHIMSFQEQHNLITLGWIHTHPTQSCFLSSLDLHTHAGYQMMLPEAIAIVCAPRCDPSFGLFRLTDPTGLRYVIACKNKGLFHPHTTQDGRDLALYTDAIFGHVSLVPQLGVQVVDLR